MTRRRQILEYAVVLGLSAAAPRIFAAAPTGTDAKSLLDDVARRYATMKSYEDRGTVTQFAGDDVDYSIRFTTAYKNPSLFRFAFAAPHPYPPLRPLVTTYVVGFDGVASYLRMKPADEREKSETAPSVDGVLAKATGVSLGAAHTLSRLLLHDVTGLSITDLVNVRSLQDEIYRNVLCSVVVADNPRGGVWNLWIEKATLLIRKVKVSTDADSLTYSVEVHDDIRVDQPLSDLQFAAGGAG